MIAGGVTAASADRRDFTQLAPALYAPTAGPAPRGGERVVKLVVAVIKPFKLDEVREALEAIDVHGMTVTEVKGYGRQKGHTEIYRGSEYAVTFLPKIKLEAAVPDGRVEAAVDAIERAARTGQIGDGKVFVQPLEKAVRIRTAENGEDAL
jgi:nitrogen regulatory protein P-II 2